MVQMIDTAIDRICTSLLGAVHHNSNQQRQRSVHLVV